jgi:hypothetical protein
MQYTQDRSPEKDFGPNDYVWAYSKSLSGWLLTPVRMVQRDWLVDVKGFPAFIAWMPVDALPTPSTGSAQ